MKKVLRFQYHVKSEHLISTLTLRALMTVNLVQKAFTAKFEIIQLKLNAMTDFTVDLGPFQLDPAA